MREVRRPDPQTEARWLDQVKAIASRVLADYEVDLYLFGSRARGCARLSSDIDLAIESRNELPPKVMNRLFDELDESTVPVRVDVIDLRHAGPELRAKVMQEGIRWIASKSA